MPSRIRSVSAALAAVLVSCAAIVTHPAAASRAVFTPTPSRPALSLYIFAGQSNMTGYRTRVAELPSGFSAPAATMFWGPTDDQAVAWVPMPTITERRGSCCFAGFGPELSASQTLGQAAPAAPAAIVKLAVNGSSLWHDWRPKAAGGLYERLVARVRAASAAAGAPVQIRALFWMQGESDSDAREHAAGYVSAFSQMVGALRRDLNAPEMPVIQGRIATGYAFTAAVRAQQALAARTVPGVTMVDTDDLEHLAADPVHLSSAGTLALGRRFAAAYLAR